MMITESPLLTIGTAVRDDFHGLYFTLTSLMTHHQEVMSRCELLVVDDNPESKHGAITKKWVEGRVPRGRYVAHAGGHGTAQPRNAVFANARGEFVLCVDCHVLLVSGAVQRLIEYYEQNPDTRDLHSGPLIRDDGKTVVATHQRPEWGAGAWGKWTVDKRGLDLDAKPFEIWQQGMGLFSCKREHWVGFHPEMRGFGGCESYVMEKTRRAGGRVMCLPFLRWTHRFQKPDGSPYRVTNGDKFRNSALGYSELGWEEGILGAMKHFRKSREQFDLAARSAPVSAPAKTRPKPNPLPGTRPTDLVAVIGDPKYGGTKLRAQPLAVDVGCKLVKPREVPGLGKRPALVYVKNGACPVKVRAKCDRLIYDPLDMFAGGHVKVEPEKYWAAAHRELKFDDVIATSPACAETMRAGLPDSVRVHIMPHNADPMVTPAWRNTDGHVAYAGLGRFVESGLDRIKQACELVGRPFKQGLNNSVLRGAAVVLALRLPPYDSEMNRYCKPQIKLENAAAANIPVVTTDDPAALSLRPELAVKGLVVRVDFTAEELAEAIRRALDWTEGPGDAYATVDYVRDMRTLVGV